MIYALAVVCVQSLNKTAYMYVYLLLQFIM